MSLYLRNKLTNLRDSVLKSPPPPTTSSSSASVSCCPLSPADEHVVLNSLKNVLSQILFEINDKRLRKGDNFKNDVNFVPSLWASVRTRGCQFLGPAVQEEILRLVLLAMQDGTSLCRKVLVHFIVKRMQDSFPKVSSKTAIGHVVQLLYRASCFLVEKKEGQSSLMQLRSHLRTYDQLRNIHDREIVQIAKESGICYISADQWSQLLYGDSDHEIYMLNILIQQHLRLCDHSSIEAFFLEKSYGNVIRKFILKSEFVITANTSQLKSCLQNLDWMLRIYLHVIYLDTIDARDQFNDRYKTSMCRNNNCLRSSIICAHCRYAHDIDELNLYKNKKNVSYFDIRNIAEIDIIPQILQWFEDEYVEQDDKDIEMRSSPFETDQYLPPINKELVNFDYQNFPIGQCPQEKFGLDMVASYSIDAITRQCAHSSINDLKKTTLQNAIINKLLYAETKSGTLAIPIKSITPQRAIIVKSLPNILTNLVNCDTNIICVSNDPESLNADENHAKQSKYPVYNNEFNSTENVNQLNEDSANSQMPPERRQSNNGEASLNYKVDHGSPRNDTDYPIRKSLNGTPVSSIESSPSPLHYNVLSTANANHADNIRAIPVSSTMPAGSLPIRDVIISVISSNNAPISALPNDLPVPIMAAGGTTYATPVNIPGAPFPLLPNPNMNPTVLPQITPMNHTALPQINPMNPTVLPQINPMNHTVLPVATPMNPTVLPVAAPMISTLDPSSTRVVQVLPQTIASNAPNNIVPILPPAAAPIIPILAPNGEPIVPILQPPVTSLIPTLAANGAPIVPMLPPPAAPLIPSLAPIVPNFDVNGAPIVPVIQQTSAPIIPILAPNGTPIIPVLTANGTPIVPVLPPTIVSSGAPTVPILPPAVAPVLPPPIIPILAPNGAPFIPNLDVNGPQLVPVLPSTIRAPTRPSIVPILTQTGPPITPILAPNVPTIVPVLPATAAPIITSIAANGPTIVPVVAPNRTTVQIPILPQTPTPIVPILPAGGVSILPVLQAPARPIVPLVDPSCMPMNVDTIMPQTSGCNVNSLAACGLNQRQYNASLHPTAQQRDAPAPLFSRPPVVNQNAYEHLFTTPPTRHRNRLYDCRQPDGRLNNANNADSALSSANAQSNSAQRERNEFYEHSSYKDDFHRSEEQYRAKSTPSYQYYSHKDHKGKKYDLEFHPNSSDTQINLSHDYHNSFNTESEDVERENYTNTPE